MKNTRFPLPKKYWMYIKALVALGVILFANIFIMVGLTEGKELRRFTQQDWLYFAIFLIIEIVIALLMFLFAIKAGKLSAARKKQMEQYFELFKYAGIGPGEYDHVWFDCSGVERAKIVKIGDAFHLYVEDFDQRTLDWTPANTVSVFKSMEEVKRALFYEFDFFCEENAIADEHGNAVFKDS